MHHPRRRHDELLHLLRLLHIQGQQPLLLDRMQKPPQQQQSNCQRHQHGCQVNETDGYAEWFQIKADMQQRQLSRKHRNPAQQHSRQNEPTLQPLAANSLDHDPQHEREEQHPHHQRDHLKLRRNPMRHQAEKYLRADRL